MFVRQWTTVGMPRVFSNVAPGEPREVPTAHDGAVLGEHGRRREPGRQHLHGSFRVDDRVFVANHLTRGVPDHRRRPYGQDRKLGLELRNRGGVEGHLVGGRQPDRRSPSPSRLRSAACPKGSLPSRRLPRATAMTKCISSISSSFGTSPTADSFWKLSRAVWLSKYVGRGPNVTGVTNKKSRFRGSGKLERWTLHVVAAGAGRGADRASGACEGRRA